MALPEVWWVNPVITLGLAASAAFTTWKLKTSSIAVDGAQVKVTIGLVSKHEERLQVLEAAKVQLTSDVGAIKEMSQETRRDTKEALGAINRLLGEINAMNRRERN